MCCTTERLPMTDKNEESLIVLGGTGNLGQEVLPILADAGYHLVVFSRHEVSGEPFEHPGVTVVQGSLDDPEFIDSMVTTALQHADKLRGALFLNGGFGSVNGIGADGYTERLQDQL